MQLLFFWVFFILGIVLKNIVVGWGKSGVGSEWLVNVCSAMPLVFLEHLDYLSADIRVIIFASVDDVELYLKLVGSGAPEVACNVPLFLVNCQCDVQCKLIEQIMFVHGLYVVSRCPYLPYPNYGVDTRIYTHSVGFKKMYALISEVVYLGSVPGSLSFWKMRAFNIRNSIEYYFDKGQGFRLRGLYVLLVTFDSASHSDCVEYWEALVRRMVDYIRLLMRCESDYDCSVFAVRDLMKHGRTHVTDYLWSEFSV